MLFNSYLFWLFFAMVALVYWRLERRAQNVWLLAVSYVFYACWDWRFTWLLALATALTYHCALAIADAANLTDTTVVRQPQGVLLFSEHTGRC